MPAVVAAGTVNVPFGFITKPVSPPSATRVGVTRAGAKATPLSVSLVNTVGVLPPPAPIVVAEKSSFTALITGITSTLAVAVSQFDGLEVWQIR